MDATELAASAGGNSAFKLDASVPASVEPQRHPTLSLVLPAFNECDTIEQAICEAEAALSHLCSDFEILVVDDGCSDGTADVVNRFAATRPNVRLLSQPRNLGYGAALARGFREAKMELVSFTDSDCQFDLRELERLMFLARDYDIVCGYRIDRQDPWLRKVYSRVYNSIVQLLLGTGVRDVDCAMKVFHREVIQGISIESQGFFVNSEVLTKARIQENTVVEVGVTHRPRAGGESTVSPLHTIPVIGSILKFWFNTILFPNTAIASSRTESSFSLRQEFTLLLGLILVCCAVLLPNLSYPLIEPDESRYVQISLEMIQTGDWITPTLAGEPYLDKPPLLYWLTAASMSVFGMNEAAARLPTALSAVLTVLMLFAIGRHLVGRRAAFCGAVALLLSGGFVLAGRFVIMDALLTCCTTACLLCGYLGNTKKCSNAFSGWWMLASVAVALGVLTKGPVALVLCVPPLVAFGWLSGETLTYRLRQWLVLAGVVLVMATPWFVAVSVANPEFLSYFFVKHNLARFAGGFNHLQPFWFYIPIVLAGMFPASMLLPSLAVFLLGRAPSYRTHRSKDLGFLLLSTLWVIGFFSLSSCKLATYILPSLPLLALLVGSLVEHCVLNHDLNNRISMFLKAFPRRATAILVGCVAAVAMVDWRIAGELRVATWLAIVGCIVMGVTIVAIWSNRRTSSTPGWVFTSFAAAGMVVFVFAELVPLIATSRSVSLHAGRAWQQDKTQPVVYFGREAYGSSLFLAGANVEEFTSKEQAEFSKYMQAHPRAVVVTSSGVLAKATELLGTSDLIPAGGRNHVHVARPRKDNSSSHRIARTSVIERR